MRRRVSITWRWYDLWVGAYYDRAARTLYVCPLPTLVVAVFLPLRDIIRLSDRIGRR